MAEALRIQSHPVQPRLGTLDIGTLDIRTRNIRAPIDESATDGARLLESRSERAREQDALGDEAHEKK